MKTSLLILSIAISFNSLSTTWNVGPTQTYTLPSQLVSLVQNNDTIRIAGGVYTNDASIWTKKNLVFIGLGTGSNRTILRYTGDIPNGKGIFVFPSPNLSDNPTIDNIAFDGAQVSDIDGGNGAGIRFQAYNLHVINCKFVNCQNGILEGNSAVFGSEVTIENSEFENNGYQLPDDPTFSGYEHNIYIGASTSVFTLRNCYLHHPRGQANSIKTRALFNYIEYNFIDEGSTGYGSYELNLAQGGASVIIGNVFIQGTSGANHAIVGYDDVTNSFQDFYFVNNTVINKYVGNVRLFNITPSSGINEFVVKNNIFASVPGATTNWFGTNTPSVLDSTNNLFSTNYLNLGFLNASANNFHLTALSTGSINLGVAPGFTSTSYPLAPTSQYFAFNMPLSIRPLIGGLIDKGAFEFTNGLGVSNIEESKILSIYPNPSNGIIHLASDEIIDEIHIFNLAGKEISFEKTHENKIKISSVGVFILKAKMNDGTIISRKLIVE